MGSTELIRRILDSQVDIGQLPSNRLVVDYLNDLFSLLFPSHSERVVINEEKLAEELERNNKLLKQLLLHVVDYDEVDSVTQIFFSKLSDVFSLILKDAEAIEKGDPAARNRNEVIRTYPGFYAISVYRIANLMHNLHVPFIPRIFTEIAHSKAGIDIHPGATIGESFFIDHGTGVVIGETTVIGNNVKIYQGVTLGALSVNKSLATTKRHPTIEDNVVIYAGATILGGATIIGKNATIGGNVWITQSIESNSTVYHKSIIEIKKLKIDE